MNKTASQKVYMKKPVPPVPYKYKSSSNARTKYPPRRRPQRVSAKTSAQPGSLLKSLSSINLVSILNSFYTIRSTVKDLRVSLEKLDSAMDSAYQMFEIAQGVLKSQQGPQSTKRRAPLQLLPPVSRRRPPQSKSSESFDLPSQKKSSDDPDSPLAGLLDNIDIGQIMALMQSPLVQNLLKQLFQGEQTNTGAGNKYAKEG